MTFRNPVIVLASIILAASGLRAQEDTAYRGTVKEIDIINWTHTDYGFTEHPLIVAELHKRFIDIALDAALATRGNRPGERFTWTVEALDPFLQWWRETTPERRGTMRKAIADGQIDLNIMPFNIHPGLDASEMDKLMDWLPADVAAKVKPTVGIQNDVNGFPRSAVVRALDRGVRYFWMGMNGRQPYPVPALHWWEMPDGRKALLWNGVSYWAGYDFFHEKRWRTMQREASDLQYRWPRDGEIFRADEESVRDAHRICVKKLAELEQKGYGLELLPLTFSNQWRSDNDGPYPSIVAFVKKWNELGLKPSLRLSTATASMERLEKTAGSQAGTIRGEFGDWWAFGLAAMPRETAVARNARYTLRAAVSPALGSLTAADAKKIDEIERDICTYYEHTFAAYDTGGDIYGTHNQGTMNEAFRYAYKAYEYARWLLAGRARTAANREPEGLIMMNTGERGFSGWCGVEKSSLREHSGAKSLIDTRTGERTALYADGSHYRFWVRKLEPHCMQRFMPDYEEASEIEAAAGPEIKTDASGWPVSIRWDGMEQPLFEGEAPVVYVSRFLEGGWWGATAVPADHFCTPAGKAIRVETPHDVVFTQSLTNERLVGAQRVMSIHKEEKRVKVFVIFDRKLHPVREPEVIYTRFPFPDAERTVTTSNGGMEYEPYADNIPNTCKTFFIADSWVKYKTADGARIWSSRTSPVFELGSHMFFLGGDVHEPADSNLLQSMIYNNGWGVNFPVEYTGKTVCEYDVCWMPGDPDSAEIAAVTDTYLAPPLMINNPSMPENELYRKWLNGEDAAKPIKTGK